MKPRTTSASSTAVVGVKLSPPLLIYRIVPGIEDSKTSKKWSPNSRKSQSHGTRKVPVLNFFLNRMASEKPVLQRDPGEVGRSLWWDAGNEYQSRTWLGCEKTGGAFLQESSKTNEKSQKCVVSSRCDNILVPGKSLERMGESAFGLDDN